MKLEMDSISDNSESLQEQLDITKRDLENLKGNKSPVMMFGIAK